VRLQKGTPRTVARALAIGIATMLITLGVGYLIAF
jgi:hypothetical protein